MKKQHWLLIAAGVLLIVAFVSSVDVGGNTKANTRGATASLGCRAPLLCTQQTVSDNTTKDLKLSAHDAKQVATDLSKIYQGFQPGQVQVGTGNIPAKAREAATLSFTGKTIKNRQMLSAFFKSDLKLAVKARHRVRHALLSKGYDKAEVKRAFANADHWFWVAPTVASQITGTTYPVKGDIVKENGARAVAPNDAIWFYVTSDGHVLKNASLRADCMNPEVTTVTPIPPGHVPPPITCVTNCQPQHQCPCITKAQASQNVPNPAPGDPNAPTKEPSAQPTVPANTSSPAPPTPGGYNGGSTTQPGQTAPPTPVVPSDDPTNTGDPGGF
jgi:hypothetical protein